MDQLVCDDVETNKKSKHKDNMCGLPKKMSHFEMDQFVCDMLILTTYQSKYRQYVWLAQQVVKLFEMDGDVKSTRHRSISQDRGYNFNLIWV